MSPERMQFAADILDGKYRRTDFSTPDPKAEMAIRRLKVDGVYQYVVMRMLDGPLYLFDDGIAYIPSEAQAKAAIALCEKWNKELAANRK